MVKSASGNVVVVEEASAACLLRLMDTCRHRAEMEQAGHGADANIDFSIMRQSMRLFESIGGRDGFARLIGASATSEAAAEASNVG